LISREGLCLTSTQCGSHPATKRARHPARDRRSSEYSCYAQYRTPIYPGSWPQRVPWRRALHPAKVPELDSRRVGPTNQRPCRSGQTRRAGCLRSVRFGTRAHHCWRWKKKPCASEVPTPSATGTADPVIASLARSIGCASRVLSREKQQMPRLRIRRGRETYSNRCIQQKFLTAWLSAE